MSLPEPSYIERDPVQVLKDCVARYELLAGAPLKPAQVQRLLIDIIVYREMLLRIGIQEAAKQNTWRYARYPMIDLLAEILGPAAGRLVARAARVTLRYTLDAVQVVDVAVPQGRRSRTKDNAVIFEVLDTGKVIAAGSTFVDVTAIAQTLGTIGNGYAPGQIAALVDPLSVSASVTNTTTSVDGANEEGTEAMRARLPDAIASYATAGPEDGYRAHAKAVSSAIIDVRVTEVQAVPCSCGSSPPIVTLTLLTETGAPSPGLLADVLAAVSPKTVRPLTDRVATQGAVGVNYAINVSLVLYKDENEAAAIADATAALQAYAAERKRGLGLAPANGPIIAAIKDSAPGVFNVNVIAPSPNPVITTVQFANCTGITVTVDSHVEEERPVAAAAS